MKNNKQKRIQYLSDLTDSFKKVMDQSEFIHKVMTLASNVGHEAEENTIGEKSSSSSSSSS